MSSVTWPCPNCGRRVPNRVSQCHCGTTKEDAVRQAEAAAAQGAPVPRARPRPTGPRVRFGSLGWDIKGLMIGLVVVALLALVRFFWPSEPERIVPVLGHVDATPSPTPRPTPKSRGFKLPWN